MSQKLNLAVQKRTLIGKKVGQLRRAGFIPAVIYGKKFKPQSVSVLEKDFHKVFALAGETGLIQLNIEGDSKSHTVLISDVSLSPVTDKVDHVDFRQVSLTEKIKANVPLELVGESDAVKSKGAIITTTLQEIEVEALPADLPSALTLDISALTDIDQSLQVKDLIYDQSKVAIALDPDTTLVTSQAPAKEVEPEPVAAAPAEGESAAAESTPSSSSESDKTTS